MPSLNATAARMKGSVWCAVQTWIAMTHECIAIMQLPEHLNVVAFRLLPPDKIVSLAQLRTNLRAPLLLTRLPEVSLGSNSF